MSKVFVSFNGTTIVEDMQIYRAVVHFMTDQWRKSNPVGDELKMLIDFITGYEEQFIKMLRTYGKHLSTITAEDMKLVHDEHSSQFELDYTFEVFTEHNANEKLIQLFKKTFSRFKYIKKVSDSESTEIYEIGQNGEITIDKNTGVKINLK